MRKILSFLALGTALLLERSAHADTFTVTTLTDAGAGSLRQAIESANAQAGADTINFAGSLNGTIVFGSDFPSITDSVTITGSDAHVKLNTSAPTFGLDCNSGNINISDLTFSGNGSGIGINGDSNDLTVRNCTITNLIFGLGIRNGATQVQNCTFSGNGSAIKAFSDCTIANSTLSGNGIGISFIGGTTTVSNTIIAGNTNNNVSNDGGTFVDGGHNLASNGLTAAQAGLDPTGLKDNGGLTQTIALVSGPAINGGDPAFDTTPLPTDQRGTGYPRKFGSAIDIGAFEVQTNPPTALTLSPNTVLAGKPSGTYVGSLKTTDADAGDTFTYSFATGTGDDNNAEFTINSAGSLRTNAAFTAGTKSILVTTTDSTGLLFTQQFTITILEAIPPTVSITSPTQNQKLLISDFTGDIVSGDASDNVGVAGVKVRLSRKRGTTNYYWNGTDFVTSQTLLNATVTTVGAPNVTWTLASQLPPQNKLDAGLYSLQVYATDAAGNKSAYVDRTFTLLQDLVAPSVSITTPTSNQLIDINNFGAGTLSGSAADNIGVASVKLKLQRKRGTVTEYWNGTAFTTTVTLFDATVTGSTSATWSYNTAIPASALDKGGYTLYATAYDGAGNKTTSPSRLFNIVGTPSAADALSSPVARSAGNS